MSIPCIFFVLHCQTPRTRIVYMLWNDHPCLYMKEDPLSPLLMYNSIIVTIMVVQVPFILQNICFNGGESHTNE